MKIYTWMLTAALAAAPFCVSHGEDLTLPGGEVLPMGDAVEVTAVSDSAVGQFLSAHLEDAFTEDKIESTLSKMGIYSGDEETGQALAGLLAAAASQGEFRILSGAGHEMAVFSVHADGAYIGKVSSLLSKAKWPGGEAGLSVRNMLPLSVGVFTLRDVSGWEEGTSEAGVGYRLGGAEVSAGTGFGLSLPLHLEALVQTDPDGGETYSLFLATEDGADFFLPALRGAVTEAVME